MESSTVATYPSAEGRARLKGASSREGKCTGVTTNVYSRKTLEKPTRGSTNFKKTLGKHLFGSCLRARKILAPHTSVTRDENLLSSVQNMTSKFIYFSFFMFFYLLGSTRARPCSYVSSNATRNSDLRSSLKARKLNVGSVLNF